MGRTASATDREREKTLTDQNEPSDEELLDLAQHARDDALENGPRGEELNAARRALFNAGRAFERSQPKEEEKPLPACTDCSFCGKATREICQMIVGNVSNARICDECVQTAVEVVLITQRDQIMGAAKEDLRVPPPGDGGGK